MYVPIAITIMIALVAIGILGMVGFGIKNIIQGKQEVFKLAVYIVPAIIFAISYLILGAVTDAAILTMLITMAILAVMLVLTGIRTTFKF
ncbi:hypothetical protein QLX67_00060 [Balneolaceae bacterium ANBcel3]|nr:hypothetical protein [Balneolaceae bacterium ANBcel3]